MLHRFALLGVVPAVTLLAACPTKSDPLSCMDGCSHQAELTFCDVDGVYPGTELANECIAPPSADACNRVEACPSGEHCTDDSMGVCVECMEGEHCEAGEVCNASGACEEFVCTPGAMGDSECAMADSSLPYCGPSQACVACLDSTNCTSANAEVCDEQTLSCRGCVASSECSSLVCEIESGQCASSADIVYVDGASSADDATCGDMANPCSTITVGLGKVSDSRSHVLVEAGNYPERLVVSDVSATVIANGAVALTPTLAMTLDRAVDVSGTAELVLDGIDITPSSANDATDAVFCVDGTASLELHNLTVSGARDVGVIVEGCTFLLSQGQVSANGGVGITTTDAAVSVSRSTISGNDGGGMNLSNSNFTIVNNVVVKNGTADGQFGGVRIAAGAAVQTQVFEFNTIAENIVSGVLADATSVDCAATNPFTAIGNILYGGASIGGDSKPSLDETNCAFEHSLIDGAGAAGSILDEDPMFVGSGDYHLQSGSPCIDAFDGAGTAVDTDIDGEMRPQGAGFDIGADEAE